ncbi:hypothetical protein FisN_5Lh238 [Fistulifera solaris]|uniref:Uncharacterized protein n=1 Tax=Fistulifera solaris TaxID=1519565 RepID=A0A1Z5JIM7_FISSO|nr:hypothetical protein FisN_5Lh238 [Fistulifera solaris]|eukprot:GAX13867.1 hypothetical protein FisN_5Lh238 [Fistulifera solaris]
MAERDPFHSDDDFGASVHSFADTFDLSPKTIFAILTSILFAIMAHWRSSIESWYRSLRFQLRHITITELIVNWWWTNVEYVQGAWFIGREILRNTFLILRGSPDFSKRDGVYTDLTEKQDGYRSSMPALLYDEYLKDVLEPTRKEQGTETTLGNGQHRQDNRAITNISATTKVQLKHEEVEPAFRREKGYPPGWLVFHSRLGVVQKSLADEYDRRKLLLVDESQGLIHAKARKVCSSFHDPHSLVVGNNSQSSLTAH